MNTFNLSDYQRQFYEFPKISYEEYEQITDEAVRQNIATKNKIIQTDAYNRTMTHLKGDKAQETETYTLTFRRSPNKTYNVVYGVRSALKKILGTPFTQQELDFAKEYYSAQAKKGWNGSFNYEMWQEVIDNGGYLPLEINAVADGTAVKVKEPIMSVRWPSELAAIFEPDFIRTFFKSIVATETHMIEQIIWEGRVAEFGRRAAANEQYHLDAVVANIVGGGLISTSNDAAALVYPQLKAGGTTAHRYFSSYPTEDAAFINAIEKSENIALLVDLIDSYQGIDKIIALKKKYRDTGKVIAMRLDSGNICDQVLYALKQLQAHDMLDPSKDKIVASDISSIEEIIEIEEAVKKAWFNPKDFIQYGLGGLLIARNKTRDALSVGYKLTEAEHEPTGKLSNDIDKEPIPGTLNIEIRNNTRYIVQEHEPVQGERLLQPVYKNGKLLYTIDDMQAIKDAREQLLHTMQRVDYPTQESEKTAQIHQKVRKNLQNMAA